MSSANEQAPRVVKPWWNSIAVAAKITVLIGYITVMYPNLYLPMWNPDQVPDEKVFVVSLIVMFIHHLIVISKGRFFLGFFGIVPIVLSYYFVIAAASTSEQLLSLGRHTWGQWIVPEYAVLSISALHSFLF